MNGVAKSAPTIQIHNPIVSRMLILDLLAGTGTHTEFHQWELRICNTELQNHIPSTALQPKSYNIGMRSIGVLLCFGQVVAFVQARAAA
jgi:hypothetical protein